MKRYGKVDQQSLRDDLISSVKGDSTDIGSAFLEGNICDSPGPGVLCCLPLAAVGHAASARHSAHTSSPAVIDPSLRS